VRTPELPWIGGDTTDSTELPALQDVTISALHAALRGLSARQRVIADNVANLETPEFLAGVVDFESALSEALQDGDDPLRAATPSFTRSLAPTGVNGNNVSLDHETLSNTETGLRYQLVSTAVNDKFRLLRTAIKGQ
jgi:flagellar basal-body rod protein FlgB